MTLRTTSADREVNTPLRRLRRHADKYDLAVAKVYGYDLFVLINEHHEIKDTGTLEALLEKYKGDKLA